MAVWQPCLPLLAPAVVAVLLVAGQQVVDRQVHVQVRPLQLADDQVPGEGS